MFFWRAMTTTSNDTRKPEINLEEIHKIYRAHSMATKNRPEAMKVSPRDYNELVANLKPATDMLAVHFEGLLPRRFFGMEVFIDPKVPPGTIEVGDREAIIKSLK